ncbi:retrotransposon protein, putative, ty1-copia subclass [Tanacetum coccineum]
MLKARVKVKAMERIKVISLSLKTLNLLLKSTPAKDDACHHYKEVGHYKRNCLAYLAELIKKKKQVGIASSSFSKNVVLYLNAIPRDGIYEIDMLNLVPKC